MAKATDRKAPALLRLSSGRFMDARAWIRLFRDIYGAGRDRQSAATALMYFRTVWPNVSTAAARAVLAGEVKPTLAENGRDVVFMYPKCSNPK